ncbi:hypothetical protein GXM_00149 [Nostoc sphaeroides CCNUC1]|uniref:Uncharacterized protein n=1 Tax=Nostoc sphaeroides CCNUC1 TaxID=2653204 RepID=A0A5P8VR09_9NOSO|nr:hypothetical protein GXM_00149 [Nostoc sphaeroides CCNUC1]
MITAVFALTLNPSPISLRGTLKFWLPESQIWGIGWGMRANPFQNR